VGALLKQKRIVRTAQVTIETEERTELREIESRSALLWCPCCRLEAELVTPERASQIAKVSTRTIYRWIEAGVVHFKEREGHLLICVSALYLTAHALTGRKP